MNSPVNIPNTIPYLRVPQNVPPPTPAPRSTEYIQEDIRYRFAGVLMLHKEADRPIDEYFLEYDHWEPYAENKAYSKRRYHASYKGLMKEYVNYLCVLNDGEGTEEFFVVAKRIRTELEELEPYCPCDKCTAALLNPFKYIWCVHCTKCIKAGSGFASPEYIERARALKAAAADIKKIPSKYNQMLSQIRWIKVFEISTMVLFLICFLTWYFF